VHPLDGLEVDNAARFIVQGGRMLLAVEPGSFYPFLERLDIRFVDVRAGELPHQRFVQGNRSLPIFSPRGKHALLVGVRTLVANHPSVLLNIGGPVVGYSSGSGLVYDMNLGQGKVVVLGDASMLINQ